MQLLKIALIFTCATLKKEFKLLRFLQKVFVPTG